MFYIRTADRLSAPRLAEEDGGRASTTSNTWSFNDRLGIGAELEATMQYARRHLPVRVEEGRRGPREASASASSSTAMSETTVLFVTSAASTGPRRARSGRGSPNRHEPPGFVTARPSAVRVVEEEETARGYVDARGHVDEWVEVCGFDDLLPWYGACALVRGRQVRHFSRGRGTRTPCHRQLRPDWPSQRAVARDSRATSAGSCAWPRRSTSSTSASRPVSASSRRTSACRSMACGWSVDGCRSPVS